MDLEYEFALEPEALELLPAEAGLTGCGGATFSCDLFTCMGAQTCTEDSIIHPH